MALKSRNSASSCLLFLYMMYTTMKDVCKGGVATVSKGCVSSAGLLLGGFKTACNMVALWLSCWIERLLMLVITASWACVWCCSNVVLLLYLFFWGLELFVTGARLLLSRLITSPDISDAMTTSTPPATWATCIPSDTCNDVPVVDASGIRQQAACAKLLTTPILTRAALATTPWQALLRLCACNTMMVHIAFALLPSCDATSCDKAVGRLLLMLYLPGGSNSCTAHRHDGAADNKDLVYMFSLGAAPSACSLWARGSHARTESEAASTSVGTCSPCTHDSTGNGQAQGISSQLLGGTVGSWGPVDPRLEVATRKWAPLVMFQAGPMGLLGAGGYVEPVLHLPKSGVG